MWPVATVLGFEASACLSAVEPDSQAVARVKMKWEGFEGPATYLERSTHSVNSSLFIRLKLGNDRNDTCTGRLAVAEVLVAGATPHRVLLSLTVPRCRGPREVRDHQGCDAGAAPYRRPLRGKRLSGRGWDASV